MMARDISKHDHPHVAAHRGRDFHGELRNFFRHRDIIVTRGGTKDGFGGRGTQPVKVGK